MNKSKYIFMLIFVSVFFVKTSFLFSQQPPSSQTAGGIAQQEKAIQEEEAFRKRIKKEQEQLQQISPEEISQEDIGPKALVNRITVEGAVLLPQADIAVITSRYEGEELSLRTMQKIADLITDEYRKKGYATSRAYLPPQTVKDGNLIIRVVEGRLGEFDIKGNRYFKTSLLKRRVGLVSGVPFDYGELQSSLTRLNEHPDRTAKVTLVPGQAQGTTDIVIELEDNYPFHIGFEYDNFGSRYIDKDRFSFITEHNNLLGFDDRLYMKFQRSESDYYKLGMFRYILPVTNTIDVGTYFIYNKTNLAREFKPLNAEGEAYIGGIFGSWHFINKQDLDLILNLGFDYKDITNDLLGQLNSEDRIRMAKLGFDLDVSDKWGRTIVTPELDIGIPHIMGGMDSEEPVGTSRQGAGGKFYKGILNLFRLQPGPFETSMLWKNQAQLSRYNLVASEEFQIGGPYSVRGYPPAEFVGDSGYYTSFELSFPPYVIVPRDLKIPFSTDYLYDVFRVVLFYDWASVSVNNAMPGQEKSQTLKGCGFGFRFTFTNDLTARIEFGYPLGKEPSDGDNLHRWIEFTKKF
ncbi:MAG: ShlB/FhaC/HecB family hemolysin secretion/activation protein [Candidatus Omnitrophica bacterium]|nr:ShlB/FhaC/HecB family hemolysin secretion/activation protein [Candidatus Omnitrophota bacterium]